jgi:hypothetical protein
MKFLKLVLKKSTYKNLNISLLHTQKTLVPAVVPLLEAPLEVLFHMLVRPAVAMC